MQHIAPSFLSADIWRVAEQVGGLEKAGCRYLHLDVMDGRFVPNISFGPPYIKSLRPHSSMVFDTHLMVEEPDRFLADFAAAGADIITVHAEACRHLHRTLQNIKALGLKAGVALNPATPLSALEEILPELDLALVMSVNPGFGGQSFIPAALDKIRRLDMARAERGCSFIIEVDGGVSADNAAALARAGAGLLVAGAAVFGQSDPAAAFLELRSRIM
ncbi:MAG: ribulose-phosphate 3-epimerase [Clostridiales bacterium]|nr:ribulose-phosphate 3-epimerase [Clostridiales bacterium]